MGGENVMQDYAFSYADSLFSIFQNMEMHNQTNRFNLKNF